MAIEVFVRKEAASSTNTVCRHSLNNTLSMKTPHQVDKIQKLYCTLHTPIT